MLKRKKTPVRDICEKSCMLKEAVVRVIPEKENYINIETVGRKIETYYGTIIQTETTCKKILL